jgi:hypothetical protein
MRKPLPSWAAYLPTWLVVVATDREFRELTVWSYALVIRVRWMFWMAKLSTLAPTPALAAMLHRHADALTAEIAALKRAMQARRDANILHPARPAAGTFTNPWT